MHDVVGGGDDGVARADMVTVSMGDLSCWWCS